MTMTPIWFGAEERPLFGWFHGPTDGQARSGVVICPPFAREYISAHYALRLLAERLCDAGACVVRFDYDGMGDSAGSSNDPGRVKAWLGSITEAVSLLRRSGVTKISLVGMRIGATLAAEAATRIGDVEQIVLWDPCVSGKSFVKEGQALSAISFGASVQTNQGFIETPGLRLEDETVEQLRSLGLATLNRPPARRALVLIRPDRDIRPDVLLSLGEESVECIEATGQSDLMDKGSPDQILPMEAIRAVARWLSVGTSGELAPFTRPEPAGERVVGKDQFDRDIVERPVFVPPLGLFGVLCQASSAQQGPPALFLSVSNEHHIGPARLWVDLARDWAGQGIPSLRLDLSGLGDSPVRDANQAQYIALAPEAFIDVVDAARFLSPDDPSNVVLVGLCGSAYQAIDSALDLHPKGVIAINPVLSFVPPEVEQGQPLDQRRQVALPKNTLVTAFHNEGPLSPLRRRFPDLGWWMRLSVAGPRRPGSWINRLGRLGVPTLVVAGDREWRPIRLGSTRFTREKWQRVGMFTPRFIPELEHGLLIDHQRQQVKNLVTEFAVRKFSPQDVTDPEVKIAVKSP